MPPPTAPPPPLRAGRREWTALAVLALPTLLVSIDVFVLPLALPHLSADLGASATEQLWITDVYGFVLAGVMLTMGTLGDRIGRRRLLLVGATGFAAASVLAAFSATPAMLVARTARESLAGASAVAERLDDASASRLLDAARESFLAGMDVALLVVAAILLALGAVVLMMLRGLPPLGRPPAEAGPAGVADAERAADVREPTAPGQEHPWHM
ncbi:MFS transporter [Georgenia sp. 10Sc9-8]|uniref:MFS transporter n=1 Tax=Georgenia halotolerans TaxID=3028317 RepID=A0ABT5U1I2_9MICO|nr:MFS transporter [Georgenia halotolerans]